LGEDSGGVRVFDGGLVRLSIRALAGGTYSANVGEGVRGGAWWREVVVCAAATEGRDS
jgi:hypothetical protein